MKKTKTLDGCAYCGALDAVDVSLCCAQHARLVCVPCTTENASYRHDHPEAA